MATVQGLERHSGAPFTGGAQKQQVHDDLSQPDALNRLIELEDDADKLVLRLGAMLMFVGDSRAALRALPEGFNADDYVMVCKVDDTGRTDPVVESFLPVSQLVVAAHRAGRIMLLFFPRLAFKGLESRIEAILRDENGFTAGSLLPSYLCSLQRHVRAVTEADALVIEQVTVQLVRAMIARMGDGGGFTMSVNNSRLECARQFIDERLASSHLTVDSIRSWLGISRRQLYLLFEPYGGVARYIQAQRLRRSREVLSASLPDIQPARVAEQCGLDPRRFGRLFKQEFGVAPAQVERNGAGAGVRHSAGVEQQ